MGVPHQDPPMQTVNAFLCGDLPLDGFENADWKAVQHFLFSKHVQVKLGV